MAALPQDFNSPASIFTGGGWLNFWPEGASKLDAAVTDDSDARVYGGANAGFDAAMRPSPFGVETFVNIRSQSIGELEWSVSLEDFERLEILGDHRSIAVINKSGTAVALIQVQTSDVPTVRFSRVDGNRFTLSVASAKSFSFSVEGEAGGAILEEKTEDGKVIDYFTDMRAIMLGAGDPKFALNAFPPGASGPEAASGGSARVSAARVNRAGSASRRSTPRSTKLTKRKSRSRGAQVRNRKLRSSATIDYSSWKKYLESTEVYCQRYVAYYGVCATTASMPFARIPKPRTDRGRRSVQVWKLGMCGYASARVDYSFYSNRTLKIRHKNAWPVPEGFRYHMCDEPSPRQDAGSGPYTYKKRPKTAGYAYRSSLYTRSLNTHTVGGSLTVTFKSVLGLTYSESESSYIAENNTIFMYPHGDGSLNFSINGPLTFRKCEIEGDSTDLTPFCYKDPKWGKGSGASAAAEADDWQVEACILGDYVPDHCDHLYPVGSPPLPPPPPPETTITGGPGDNETVASNAPSFTFTTDTGTSFECSVDESAFSACASPHALANLAEGDHIFGVRALGPGGIDDTPEYRNFTVDTTPPDTAIKTSQYIWTSDNMGGADTVLFGDINNDGKEDAVGYSADETGWGVARSAGSQFVGYQSWLKSATNYGVANSRGVLGDWNNDGIDTPGYFNSSLNRWYLSNNAQNPTNDAANGVLWSIPSGGIPVAGDWDGNGFDSIGYYEPATGKWTLSNSISSPSADAASGVTFGPVGSRPIVGNWNGLSDARDSIGVYHPATSKWYLSNSIASPTADAVDGLVWGGADSLPVAGDWDGDGSDSIGAYSPEGRTWILSSQISTEAAAHDDASVVRWGRTGMSPIAGDFDGDGAAELGGLEQSSARWHLRGAINDDSVPLLDDVDDDGRADAVLFDSYTGTWNVARSNGTTFDPYHRWASGLGVGAESVYLADVNGDDASDAVYRDDSSDEWMVALSDPVNDAFLAPSVWSPNLGTGATQIMFEDVTGDGQADATAYFSDSGDWAVSRSNGTSFDAPQLWRTNFSVDAKRVMLGDVDNDNDADAIAIDDRGTWFVAKSTTTSFSSVTGEVSAWATKLGDEVDDLYIGDVNGDGRVDAGFLWPPGSGSLYFAMSTGAKFDAHPMDFGSPVQYFAFDSERNTTFQCKIDSGSWSTCLAAHHTAPLSPGIHTISVRAMDAVGNVDPTPATRKIVVQPELRVDFGQLFWAYGEGYTLDPGAPYGTYGAFGWKAANGSPVSVTTTTDLISPVPDNRYWGIATFGSEIWEAALPNGDYKVHVVAGKSSPSSNAAYKINAESTTVIDGAQNAQRRFIEDTRTITITDGALTISGAAGYTNDIAYVDVKPVTDNVSPDTTITSGPAENASIPANVASFAFSSTEPNSNFECRLDGGIFAACESPYTTPKLTNGRHTVTVIATNQSGNSDLTPATRTFVVNPDQTLRVNFQPPGQPKADGYLADSGADFGNRNNGYTYGWSNGTFGTYGPRERNSTNAPDKRYDTLIHMGGPALNQTSLSWSINVPRGNYRVRVVAGDPSYFDSVYKLDVQGKRVVDAVPTDANRWAEGTVDVASTGTIAITQAAGAVNNKLDFVEITPITVESDTTPPVVTVSGSGEYGLPSPGSTASFNVGVNEVAAVTCKLDTAAAVPCLDDSAAELCQTFASGIYGAIALPYMDGQPFCSKPVVYNNLSLGMHTFTVVATDEAGNQSTSTRVFTVAEQAPIKINFQPSAAPTHPGYLVDSGVFYGNGVVGGYTFGWFSSNATSPSPLDRVDRNNNLSADQRYDTYIDIGGADNLQRDISWAIAVPNGSYEVKLVAGDPGNLASIYKVDVEGQRIIDAIPTAANPWVEGTKRVTVNDGMLSLSQPVGARNNKLNFIDITPINDDVAPVINVTRPAPNAQLTSGNVAFSFMADEAVKYQCRMDGGSFADCKPGKTYSGLSAGAHSLTITATDAAGNVGMTTRNFTVFGTAPIKVNFQPAGAEVHAGNLVDSGALFAQRRNGYKYGWWGGFFSSISPPPMVERNAINSPDQRYDTFAALGANSLGGSWDHNWMIAVPSGQYSVRVVAGDPAEFTGNYMLNVQDKPVISGAPSAANPWLEGTVVVEAAATGVGESTINISQGYGANLNKIAFVEITPLDGDTTAPQLSIDSPINGVSMNQTSAVLEFSSNEEAVFTCELDSGAPVACGNDELSQFCRNTTAGLGGTEWISVPATDYCSPTKIYSNLSAGSHTVTVTATDANGNVSTSTSTFTVVPPSTEPIRINFQPSAAPTHPGYLVDSGQAIDLFSSNGPNYGWFNAATPTYSPTVVDRNSAASADQRYDTFASIGGADGLKRDLKWMKVLESGVYDVRVVMGDPTSWDAVYKLDVGGHRIVDGVPTEGSRWVEGTKRVRVDTILSLTQPEGARNNKISFVEITRTNEAVPPTVSISSPAEGAPVNSTAAVSFTADTVTSFQCKIDEGAFAPCKSTQKFAGLSVGAHVVTVSATDTDGNTGTATRTFNVVPAASMTAAINFQPGSSTGYPGYQVDSGLQYGDRGNGAMYGWGSAIVNSTDRGVSTDERYDTFVAPGDNAASWEMALPYGTYRVHLVAGDPSDSSSIYKWNAEGSRIIDGSPTVANRFVEGTRDVTVSDGKLTISTVRGGANQKLAFVEIAPVADTNPPRIQLSGIEEGDTLNQTTASVGIMLDENATVQCKLDDGAFGSCGTLRPFGWSMAYAKSFFNLAWGSHTITVSATDTAGNTSTATRSFVIGGPQQLKFQFLPGATVPEKGYMADNGGLYSEADNGQSYGWAYVPSTSSATRSTNRSLDARYDSFVGMTAGGWTLKLMNGTYKVRVVAGDPLTPNIPYKVDVEDTRVIDAVPSNLQPWIDETKKVTVVDGYLNVTSPVGSGEARLNFIEVTRVEDDVAPNVYIAAPVNGADAGNGNVVPSFRANEPATFRCRMDTGDFTACEDAYNSLSLGSHVFSVEATDGNNNVSVTSSTFTVNLPQIRVMFGPAGVSHPGYMVDTGADYGARDNGFAYGWSRFGANTWPATYDRNLPYSPDQRYDSFIDISGGDGLSRAMQWDIELPTGTYEVHVVEGDALAPADYPSYYKLDVEGTNVTNGVPGPQNRWVEGTVVVDVVDGKLTLKQDIEGFNNKLNYVDIRPVDLDRTAPETSAISPGETITNTTPEIAFSSNEEGSTFQCKIDTGLFAACTSPYSPGPLTDGGHVVQVRAIDPAGNVDKTAALVSFTVDTGPPVVVITAPSTVTGDATPTIEFSATDANAIVETSCSLNGATGTSCVSGSDLPTLTDGMHTVAVTATDGAGFSSTATMTFTVDTAAPNTSITSGPESGSAIATATPTFVFSSSEAGTYECNVDSSEWSACTSTFSTSSLTDGSHTFNVRAKDSVGNIDQTPESRTFTVDTVAPDTTIVSWVPSGTIINTRTPNHGFISTDPGGFECKIDSGEYESCTSPDTAASLADGSHTFYVRSQDVAGNYDPTPASRTFVVDLTPPVAPSNITFSSVTQTSATINWTAATDANGIAIYNIYRDGNFVVGVGGTSSSISGLTCGTTYTINVVANDPANNFTVSSNASLVTANCATPPVVTIASPVNDSKLTSTSQPVAFTATELPTSVTCMLDGGTAVACTSPHVYTGLSQGTHSVTVAAANAAGTGTAVVNFVVDSIAPVVSVTTPAVSATTGSSVTADFTASDATTAVVDTTCRMDAGAAVSCSTGHAYSGLAAGNHTLIVAATDEAGNVGSVTRTFTVATTPVVTISAPTNGSLTSSTSASIAFTATNSPTSVTCQLDGGTATACTSPRAYSGLTQGAHSVTVAATNSAGTGTAVVNFTVDSIAPVVTITTPATSATTGSSVATAFTATDATTSVVGSTCKMDTGAAVSCVTGHAYSGLTAGSHTLIVTATDQAGNVGSVTRTFTVALPPVVTISAPSNGSLTSSTSASIVFAATNSPTTTTCQLDTGVATACSSPRSYTGLAAGSHTVTIAATNAGGTGTAAVTFTVDTIAPDTTINSGPANGASQSATTATYGFSSTESGTFECKIDSGTYAVCASPFTTPTMSAGLHTFYVRAKDQAGNYDASPATRTVTVSGTGLWEYGGTNDATGWGAVSLSAFGSYDWLHWGRSAVGDVNRKSPTASPGIGAYTLLGTGGTVTRTVVSATTFGWSGGAPVASEAGTGGGLAIGGALNRGFRVSIPVTSANNRMIYVGYGLLNTQVKITASISDGSITTVSDTPLTNTSTTTPTIAITGFRVRSASPTATLYFDIQQNTSSSTGSVRLYGATVANE